MILNANSFCNLSSMIFIVTHISINYNQSIAHLLSSLCRILVLRGPWLVFCGCLEVWWPVWMLCNQVHVCDFITSVFVFFNQTYSFLVHWLFLHPKNRTTLPLIWSYGPSGTFINSWKVPKTCFIQLFIGRGKKNPAKIVNGLGEFSTQFHVDLFLQSLMVQIMH